MLFWRLGQWLFWKPQVAPHIFIENMEIDLILPLTTGMDYTNLGPDQWLHPFSATLVAANGGAAQPQQAGEATISTLHSIAGWVMG